MQNVMKAAVVCAFDKPLTIEEVPVPRPGAGDVLVKIEACGVCHTDLHAAEGDWPVKPSPPFIPGHEGVGVVAAVGAGVEKERIRALAVQHHLHGDMAVDHLHGHGHRIPRQVEAQIRLVHGHRAVGVPDGRRGGEQKGDPSEAGQQVRKQTGHGQPPGKIVAWDAGNRL